MRFLIAYLQVYQFFLLNRTTPSVQKHLRENDKLLDQNDEKRGTIRIAAEISPMRNQLILIVSFSEQQLASSQQQAYG